MTRVHVRKARRRSLCALCRAPVLVGQQVSSDKLGMYARDLFLLVSPSPTTVTTGRWARQIHARKVQSYLWIFETGGYRRRG